MSTLDDWLPTFDVRERHARTVAAPPERAVAAALAMPAAPDRIVALLFRLRGLRPGGRIEELLGGRTVELERTPTRWIAGLAGRPWQPSGRLVQLSDADGWRAHAEPATVRMAVEISATEHPHGSLLATETRVAAVDAAARRAFRRYWLVVGPFSGLVRRRWLLAAARSLE